MHIRLKHKRGVSVAQVVEVDSLKFCGLRHAGEDVRHHFIGPKYLLTENPAGIGDVRADRAPHTCIDPSFTGRVGRTGEGALAQLSVRGVYHVAFRKQRVLTKGQRAGHGSLVLDAMPLHERS